MASGIISVYMGIIMIGMAYEDSDYTFMIAINALSQPYNFGAETHLGGGDTSAFVVPSAAIARSLSLTLVASPVLRIKAPQRF